MNRSAKRHRSTKVPNVKLRPAPPPKEANASARTREQDAQAEEEAMRHYRALRTAHASGKQKEENGDDEESEEEDEGKDTDDQAPLVGCVICTTGFDEEKVSLHECAIALGATVDGNLTQSATHLIAKEPGSDKYNWAVKLGIPILRPAWLYELRSRWQKAIPMRFDDLIEEHRLDTFQGLTMAMAGVTDVEKRKKIRADVKSASGQTPMTFKLDNSFTHLLCEDVKGSETLQVVNKYLQKAVRYRRRGEEVPSDVKDGDMMLAALKLKMVWVEWVQDCLTAQCCIPESLYSINELRMNEKQRQVHIDAILTARAAKAKSTAAAMQASKLAHKDPIKAAATREVKSGRTAGDGESKALKHNIPRPTTKRPNMAIEQLMEQINHSKTVDKQTTPPIAAIESSDRQTANDEGTAAQPTEPRLEKHVDEHVVAPTAAKVEDGQRTTTAGDDDDDDDDALEINEAAGLGMAYSEKSLSQMSFRVNLFDDFKNQRVFAALRKDGISTLLQPDDPWPADFHILPLTIYGRNIPAGVPHPGKPVTHFFIERCLTEKRLLRLDESFALQPSPHSFPIPGAETVHIALTGLGSDEDGPDRYQVVMALQEAGIKTAAIFKRGVHTHLLVGKFGNSSSSSTAKMERAKKWGVPVVGLEFVEQLYRDGTIIPSPIVVTNAACQSRPSVAGDDNTFSQDQSTMLRETQAADLPTETHVPIPSEIKQDSPRVGNAGLRSWLRKTPEAKEKSKESSVSFANVPEPSARKEPVDKRPALETQQSLELATQVLSASSDQVMALLNQHRLTSTDAAGTSTASTSAMGGRKPRRLPPSMRERMRERSGTPLAEQTPERQIADEPAMDSMQFAEEVLARGREQEVLGLLQGNYSNATQSITGGGGGDDEVASMRIVYDDPIARREKRKIEAIIMQTIKNRGEEAREEGGGGASEEGTMSSQPAAPQKHIMSLSNESSPLKRVRSMVSGHSPTIKARRQPGTAGREGL